MPTPQRIQDYRNRHRDYKFRIKLTIVLKWEQEHGEPAADDPRLIPDYAGIRYENNEIKKYFIAKRAVIKWENENPGAIEAELIRRAERKGVTAE